MSKSEGHGELALPLAGYCSRRVGTLNQER